MEAQGPPPSSGAGHVPLPPCLQEPGPPPFQSSKEPAGERTEKWVLGCGVMEEEKEEGIE